MPDKPTCSHSWLTVITVNFAVAHQVSQFNAAQHRQCTKCDEVNYYVKPDDKSHNLHELTGWQFDNPANHDFCYTFIKTTQEKRNNHDRV